MPREAYCQLESLVFDLPPPSSVKVAHITHGIGQGAQNLTCKVGDALLIASLECRAR